MLAYAAAPFKWRAQDPHVRDTWREHPLLQASALRMEHDGSQPHETCSRAVNAVTCAAQEKSDTCTLQFDVTRTLNLVETNVDDTWPGWRDWKA